jgi:hypothetical protein
MIPSPFRFEKDLTAEDFQKLGQLILRWSHMEHIVGHCLRLILGLTEEQATALIFPLNLEVRLQRIADQVEQKPLSPPVNAIYREMLGAIKTLQPIRNLIAHGVLLPNVEGEHDQFHSRQKSKRHSKEEIFRCEALINYAAHAALLLRQEFGDPGAELGPLPQRPAIPAFLQSNFPKPHPRSAPSFSPSLNLPKFLIYTQQPSPMVAAMTRKAAWRHEPSGIFTAS